ncbi:unnamed protein product [Paramecium pentaurelia]|uniref:Calcium-dependent protein kinase n=1 Tax=Paramecium pentaurelia TaxID=43138 RepID=A0A8S1U5M5_9CILI|nr:unnamed protein product [Paramecium pentaurelia]
MNQHPLGKLKTDEKQIESYRYNFKKGKLGKGAYGTVYKGINIHTKQNVAIKLVRKSDMKDVDDEKQLLNEIQILKSLKNPNIIEIIDVLQTENNYYIILEYCNHGDLESLIYKTHQITHEDHFQFLIDILTAFTTLIKQGIMHRDLKPANILVHIENNRKIFKLGDFGFARQISNYKNQIMESKVGTPYYMSPQILNGQQYTSKSDIWSIGLMLYQIIYQKTPWLGRSESELLYNIVHQNLKFPEVPNVNELCKDFILNCLQIKEENRFSWDTLYRHPYISEYFIKFQMQRSSCQKKLFYIQNYLKQKIPNVDTLTQIFQKVDTSGDQQLNLEEFKCFIQYLDNSFNDDDVKYIFDEFDRDGNGYVDFEEFKQYLYPSPPKKAKLQRSLQKKHMIILQELSNLIQQYNMSPRQLFRKYDTSNNNSLDKQELYALLKKIDLNNQLQLEDIETIINVFDENDDGEIQFEEFKKCLSLIHNDELFTINSSKKMIIETDEKIQSVPQLNKKISIEQLHNQKYIQNTQNQQMIVLQTNPQISFNLCQCNI